jgi:hypothetical protein
MARKDIHRPSAEDFDPQAYSHVATFDLTDPETMEARTGTVGELVANGTKFANHQVQNHCGHCGVSIKYAALLIHGESNEMIWVGETCLDGRFSNTKAQFKRLRAAAKVRREHNERLRTFAENLAEAVAFDARLAVLDDYEAADAVSSFLADIRGRLFRFPLSPRQLTAAVDVIEKEAERRARIEAERESSIAAPEGKQEISGIIRTIKVDDNPYTAYGMIVKMVVRDDRGFSVWVSVPANIKDSVDRFFDLKGRRVTFTATITRSDDDETFCFGKRPTKAALSPIEVKELQAV